MTEYTKTLIFLFCIFGFFALYGLWALVTGEFWGRFGEHLTGTRARFAGVCLILFEALFLLIILYPDGGRWWLILLGVWAIDELAIARRSAPREDSGATARDYYRIPLPPKAKRKRKHEL